MPFRFTTLEIPDVILVEPTTVEDPRGSFLEMYRRSEFLRAGISRVFVQDNYSRSIQRVLRGLHYQKPPKAQGKTHCVADPPPPPLHQGPMPRPFREACADFMYARRPT